MNKKNKKGMSLMVEYVLIIVFSIVLALIVYGVLKTYVPQSKIECPEGTSLLIENYNYDCTNQVLTLTITNDGRFNVTGYFVYISDSIHDSTNAAGNITFIGNPPMLEPLGIEGIKLGMDAENPFPTLDSTFEPGDVETEEYNFVGVSDRVYSITIVPMRWQDVKGKMRMVSCAEQKITKTIVCS